jgi:hypothetical protein
MVYRVPHRVSQKAIIRGPRGMPLPLITPRYLAGTRVSQGLGPLVVGTVTLIPGSGDWTGNVSFTQSTGGITASVIDDAIHLNTPEFDLTGDFTLTFDMTAGHSGSNEQITYGVGEADEIGSFNPNDGNGGMGSFTDSFFYAAHPTTPTGNECLYGGADDGGTDFTPTDGQTIKVQRISGEIKWYVADVLRHTFGTTTEKALVFIVAQGGVTPFLDMDNIQLVINE